MRIRHKKWPEPAEREPVGDKNQLRRNIIATVAIIIAAPVVAILLTLYVFQQYQVDGISMRPTLQNANRLIVWKAPVTWAKITGNPWIPARGDIVIFNKNDLYGLSQSGTETLIKRVIGLPGDHVVVKNGNLKIYNEAHPNGFQPRKALGFGKKIPKITSGDVNLVVPPGEMFVCGDNRPNSLDSRIFGPVPVKNIIGELVLRITPLDEIEGF
jgi:signal peptidase I